jgi:Spy/CpxP family protein refolding chaperone
MRIRNLMSVLAAGLLLAGSAAAQPPGGFGGRGFGGFGGGLAGMIGQNKQLQDELKVSKEQADKLADALAKVRDDLKDDLAKLRDRNTSDESRTEVTKKLADANAKAVAGVLNADQVKRLHQIENQQAGVGMFAKEDVKTALKLTDDQNDKIKEIREDLQSVVKVLNDEQKTTLKDLTGEPFELRFGFGGAGGPGGFGAGGFGPGRGGPGGFGGPQVGQVLAGPLQERLKLTDDQKKQVEELQKDVDGKLGKILTDEQNKQLKEMRDNAGRGGPGGRRPGDGNPPPP